eukprot:2045007-Amphidinium_carterae.1
MHFVAAWNEDVVNLKLQRNALFSALIESYIQEGQLVPIEITLKLIEKCFALNEAMLKLGWNDGHTCDTHMKIVCRIPEMSLSFEEFRKSSRLERVPRREGRVSQLPVLALDITANGARPGCWSEPRPVAEQMTTLNPSRSASGFSRIVRAFDLQWSKHDSLPRYCGGGVYACRANNGSEGVAEAD